MNEAALLAAGADTRRGEVVRAGVGVAVAVGCGAVIPRAVIGTRWSWRARLPPESWRRCFAWQ
jgi:hypothetical protein